MIVFRILNLIFIDEHQKKCQRSCKLIFAIAYQISSPKKFYIIMLFYYITRCFVSLILIAFIKLCNEDLYIYICKVSSLRCQCNSLFLCLYDPKKYPHSHFIVLLCFQYILFSCINYKLFLIISILRPVLMSMR